MVQKHIDVLGIHRKYGIKESGTAAVYAVGVCCCIDLSARVRLCSKFKDIAEYFESYDFLCIPIYIDYKSDKFRRFW